MAAKAADLSTREVRGAESASDAAPNATDVNALRRSQDEYSHRSAEATKAQTGRKMNTCYGCGGAHNRESCRFRDAQCRFCRKIGHIERVCLMKQRRDASATTTSSTNAVDTEACQQEYHINHFPPAQAAATLKRRTTMLIEGKECTMEVDSGSEFSIISAHTYRELCGGNSKLLVLFEKKNLSDFQGNAVKVQGACQVHV